MNPLFLFLLYGQINANNDSCSTFQTCNDCLVDERCSYCLTTFQCIHFLYDCTAVISQNESAFCPSVYATRNVYGWIILSLFLLCVGLYLCRFCCRSSSEESQQHDTLQYWCDEPRSLSHRIFSRRSLHRESGQSPHGQSTSADFLLK